VLITAAVCPHPPPLVPEVASGAASELADLRATCHQAVHHLFGGGTDGPGSAGPDLVVVVGAGAETRDFGADAAGSLRPYGVDVVLGTGEAVLPLSLTIGRWLLGDRGAVYQSVAQDAPPQECARLGAELAARVPRVALLVMGDGAACRTERAPGYYDTRSEAFDAEAAFALANADTGALSRIDPDLAADLQAAGRAPWQVLAGAAGNTRFSADLLADEAPYGVGYLVATWTRL
jgi:hypothetical protein